MYAPPLMLQVILVFGAAIALYVALFSYEDEDQKLQDSLETWWVQIRDVEGGLLKKAREFSRHSNDMVERFLNTLLGYDIISRRFVSISITLSFVPALPVISSLFSFEPAISFLSPRILLLSPIISLFFLWRALRTMWTQRPPHILAGVLVALVWAPLLLLLDPNYDDDYEWLLVLAALLSMASDAVATMAARALLRAAGSKYPLAFFSLFPAAVWSVVGAFALLSPFFLGPFGGGLLLIMNIPTMFFALLVWFVPFILLIGKLSLHVLGRGLYSLQRYRIFHNKKLMWGAAILQLSAVPFTRKLLEQLHLVD